MFITRLFSQNITIEQFTGKDGYNVPTYGTLYNVKCREETDFVYLRENFRELQTTDTVLYVLSPVYTPQIEDRVTFISGEQFPIKHIIRNRNDIGTIKFYTVIMGK